MIPESFEAWIKERVVEKRNYYRLDKLERADFDRLDRELRRKAHLKKYFIPNVYNNEQRPQQQG